MSAVALWAQLAQAGVELFAAGDALDYDAPLGTMTAPLVALLRAEKAPLLALVSGTFRDEIYGWGPELRCLFDERAALLEYDGGLLRADAERAAYLEVRDTVFGSAARVLDDVRRVFGPRVTVEVRARSTGHAAEIDAPEEGEGSERQIGFRATARTRRSLP